MNVVFTFVNKNIELNKNYIVCALLPYYVLCGVNYSLTTFKQSEKLKLTNLVSVQVFAVLYTICFTRKMRRLKNEN